MSARSPLSYAKRAVKTAIRRRLLDGRFRPSVQVGESSGGHLPVIMCLWNRPERLQFMIDSLAAQQGTDGIDLYLWNNARHDHEFYESVVRQATLTGAVRSVQLVRSPYNLGSIARFYFVRKLALQGYDGPIVVVDDDENVDERFVSDCLRAYSPDALTAWWAFQIGESYWDREPAVVGGPVDHIGPGGMVCSAALFADPAFFTELPERYWPLDDLWLTYFAKKRGLSLRKLNVEVEFVLPETNQHSLNPLKDEFWRYLYLGEGRADTVA